MKTVFLDVDTQIDFISPAGALYVPRAEQTAPLLASLTRFAEGNGIQIISTVDAHTEDDPEFQIWKPHCVAGTQGQQKCSQTRLASSLVIGVGPDSLRSFETQTSSVPQIIVEKRKIDPFSNPNLDPLLASLRIVRYVVYGVVTEHCVSMAVLGLLHRKADVSLVFDAVKSLSPEAERTTLALFKEQGCRLIQASEMLSI